MERELLIPIVLGMLLCVWVMWVEPEDSTSLAPQPQDCEVQWGAWSDCVNGLQTRDFTVVTYPSLGGAACPQRQVQWCPTSTTTTSANTSMVSNTNTLTSPNTSTTSTTVTSTTPSITQDTTATTSVTQDTTTSTTLSNTNEQTMTVTVTNANEDPQDHSGPSIWKETAAEDILITCMEETNAPNIYCKTNVEFTQTIDLREFVLESQKTNLKRFALVEESRGIIIPRYSPWLMVILKSANNNVPFQQIGIEAHTFDGHVETLYIDVELQYGST